MLDIFQAEIFQLPAGMTLLDEIQKYAQITSHKPFSSHAGFMMRIKKLALDCRLNELSTKCLCLLT